MKGYDFVRFVWICLSCITVIHETFQLDLFITGTIVGGFPMPLCDDGVSNENNGNAIFQDL